MSSTIIDELVKAYKTALDGNIIINGVTIPVYVDFVERQKNDSEYILIQNPSSKNAASKQDRDEAANIQLIIYSRRINNDGSVARLISEKILEIIYPDCLNQSIVLDGYQNISIQKVSDDVYANYDTNDIDKAFMQVKERIMIFKHEIS